MQSEKINKILNDLSPQIYNMLSDYGKRIFFPSDGILSQSAQAKEKAWLYNASIGIATEAKQAMSLDTITKQINLQELEYLKYAPSFGIKELRETWQAMQKEKNPTLNNKAISLPIVTNALTHGIFLATSLFLNPEEDIILPNFYWGNYNLSFKHTFQLNIKTFQLLDEDNNFNHQSFQQVLQEQAKKHTKINILLNFPNNPSGYSLLKKDLQDILDILKQLAEQDVKIVVLCDDAYFGLFFEKDVFKESIFSYLADLHKNIFAIKIDGATKEDYVWGLRCGFITYACKDTPEQVYKILEDKSAGALRASLSNISHLSQRLVLNSLKDKDYTKQKEEKFSILFNRYKEVKKAINNDEFKSLFQVIAFNSGYFFTLRILFNKTAEQFRLLLLDQGIGVIALQEKLIRIAFSCIEEENIKDLMQKILEIAKQSQD